MIRILKINELIQIEDLLKIRASYPIEDTDLELLSNRYLFELNENYNRVFFLGFDNENSPSAYVQLIIKNADNDPDLADGNQIAHIHDLRVRSDLQGKGFGKALIKHLEVESYLRGIKLLTLGVDSWNSRAIRFYENLGYAKFKEEPGRTEDEICYFMRKPLN